MALGGIARRIVNLADAAVGKFTGGLGMATVIGCMFFAAISGSGPATVTAMGSIMLPEMEKRGYDWAFSTGLTATAGTIGVIIPPSIPFVIYGVASGTSVGDMFKAGFIPGILIGIGLMIVCWVISKKRGYKGIERTKNDESFLKVFLDSLPALMAPVIILGGIYSGLTTPTEAACISVFYSLFVSLFIYRTIRVKDIWDLVISSVKGYAPLCFILAIATAFSRVLTLLRAPQDISAFMAANISSSAIFLLAVVVLFFLLGMVMDTGPAIVIMAPIFLPTLQNFGVSPIHFGVILVVCLAIGLVTPPFGLNLFVVSPMVDTPVMTLGKKSIPFILVFLIAVLLITYIPALSLMFL